MIFGESALYKNTVFYMEDYIQYNNQEELIVNETIDPDEGYGNKLRPIFVVLLYSNSTFDKIAEKFVKNQNYWHAAISFGPALTRCYSF